MKPIRLQLILPLLALMVGLVAVMSTSVWASSTNEPEAKAALPQKPKDKHQKRSGWRFRPPAIRFQVRNSTAYCGRQRLAVAGYTRDGIVAVPRSESLGRWYQVRSGPLKGKVLHALDHIGDHSEFDIYLGNYDSVCQAYGRRDILIAQITPTAARKVRWRQHHQR